MYFHEYSTRHGVTHPLPHHLKLVGTSYQLGVLAVPQVITAHKVEVLVPAGIQPLLSRSLLIDGREDDFIPEGLGGVGVGEGGTPVKVPEGCHLAASLLCEVCPAGPKVLQVVHKNFAHSSQACAHKHV